LETIREFATECLERSGSLNPLGQRHAEYFRDFARSLGLYAEAVEERVDARHDLALAEEANLRAALEWSHANNPDLGLDIAIALEQHWVSHNLVEGNHHVESLLAAQRRELPREVRAHALRCLSGISQLLGDMPRARSLIEESLAIYTELDDEWQIIHIRHRLAICALELGDLREARDLWEENVVRARALGSRYAEAEALGGLGWVTELEGDLETAWRLTQEHVAVVEEVGWRWGEVLARIYLAALSLSLGRLDACEAEARAALSLARELDDRQNTVRALAVLAARAGVGGDAERAARLWGAIEAEEARGPIGRGESHRVHRERALAGGGDEVARALEAGRAMTLAEAATYALSD
jgi:non-specific serine/threonine protein kinase